MFTLASDEDPDDFDPCARSRRKTVGVGTRAVTACRARVERSELLPQPVGPSKSCGKICGTSVSLGTGNSTGDFAGTKAGRRPARSDGRHARRILKTRRRMCARAHRNLLPEQQQRSGRDITEQTPSRRTFTSLRRRRVSLGAHLRCRRVSLGAHPRCRRVSLGVHLRCRHVGLGSLRSATTHGRSTTKWAQWVRAKGTPQVCPDR